MCRCVDFGSTNTSFLSVRFIGESPQRWLRVRAVRIPPTLHRSPCDVNAARGGPGARAGLLGPGDHLRFGGGRRLGLVVSLEPLHFLDELPDVLELPVHGREAHVGDRVEPLQVLHHDPAELLAGNFFFGALVELRLDLGDDVVHRLHPHRPLLAGLQDRAAELLAVEGLPAAVALDDVREHVLDVLVRRVAPLTFQALAPAADELAVTPDPGVDDPILRVAAKRAFHRPGPPLTSSAPDRAGSGWSAPGRRRAPALPPRRSPGSTAPDRSGPRSRPSRSRASRAWSRRASRAGRRW